MEAAIRGLADFSTHFHGKIWLEILFVENLNDSLEHIDILIKAIKGIRLDRIQLNTVARPPMDSTAKAVTGEHLLDFAARIRAAVSRKIKVEILVDVQAQESSSEKKEGVCDLARTTELLNKIVRMLRRRPCTEGDIAKTLMVDTELVRQLLEQLVASKRIKKQEHRNRIFFQLY